MWKTFTAPASKLIKFARSALLSMSSTVCPVTRPLKSALSRTLASISAVFMTFMSRPPLGFGVFAAELRGMRALAALFPMLQARGAGPASLQLVLHLDVQRADLLDGQRDRIAIHEGIEA